MFWIWLCGTVTTHSEVDDWLELQNILLCLQHIYFTVLIPVVTAAGTQQFNRIGSHH